ncbi:MAG TPA: hypothetical protein VFR18_24735 [Terriglobia bacterium]|nr:hypothetical protein [Terriglobia bacterium]
MGPRVDDYHTGTSLASRTYALPGKTFFRAISFKRIAAGTVVNGPQGSARWPTRIRQGDAARRP